MKRFNNYGGKNMRSDSEYSKNNFIDAIRKEIILLGTNKGLDSNVSLCGIDNILEKDIEGSCYKTFYSEDGDVKNVYHQDPAGNNCLLFAIALKLYPLAEKLIDDAKGKLSDEEYKDFLNYQYVDVTGQKRSWYTNTALTLATKHNQYQLAQKLLNEGADPNGTDEYGLTSLSVLCFHLGLVSEEKNTEIVELIKLLKSKGADYTHEDLLGLKPLDYLTKDLDGQEIRGYYLLPVDIIKQTKSITFGGWYVDDNKTPVNILEHWPVEACEKELMATIGKENVDRYYVSAIQNSYAVDGKIFNSFIWGNDSNLVSVMRDYEFSNFKNEWRNAGPVTRKQDFFNSPQGLKLKSLLEKEGEIAELVDITNSLLAVALETKDSHSVEQDITQEHNQENDVPLIASVNPMFVEC
ncbi:ankyrin repeat domain-containing protein [Candidatus Tisiphia endosymbiont of Micropterix aruncella]|uniref:ankyrin repeat domain-containing protein n=1 Tax=Candidatus Tisiphia endosymbiont of Micropterix aruncella TaxID=3066271 RepID=UPI003AA815D6